MIWKRPINAPQFILTHLAAFAVAVSLASVGAAGTIEGAYEILFGGPGGGGGGQGWGGEHEGGFNLRVDGNTVTLEPVDLTTNPPGYEWSFPAYPAVLTDTGFAGSRFLCGDSLQDSFEGVILDSGILSITGFAHDCGPPLNSVSFGFAAMRQAQPVPAVGALGIVAAAFFISAAGIMVLRRSTA